MLARTLDELACAERVGNFSVAELDRVAQLVEPPHWSKAVTGALRSALVRRGGDRDSGGRDTQSDTQTGTQSDTQSDAQSDTQSDTQSDAQSDAQSDTQWDELRGCAVDSWWAFY